jgi:hypothetical protein
MSITLIDSIQDVVLHNGIIRIDCIATGPNGEQRPSGTLVISSHQTGAVLQTLIGAMQEIERRLREQAQVQQEAAAGTA